MSTEALIREILLGGGSDLILEPGKLKWSRGGGLQRVTLSNPTNERRAVKVLSFHFTRIEVDLYCVTPYQAIQQAL